MKKAIVIGGGIGGLSIAARLLKKGFKVDLYERNSTIGGKTNFFINKDFKFDLTASLLMIPKDYTEIFSYCDKDYTDYFNLLPINPLYKVFYQDGTNYTFSTKLPLLCNTIDKIMANDKVNTNSYFDFLTTNYKKYLLAEKYFLNKPFLSSSSFFNIDTLSKTYSLHTLHSCYKDCAKFISNEKLINYLMFQSMYVGVSPYASPSIYNLIPTATQLNGLYYIKGGMYSYIEALAKLVIDLGGNIHINSQVDKIIFKDKTAVGIKVDKNIIISDIVVSSADYSYTVKNLFKNTTIVNDIKSVNTLEHSCSTFILYLALDKKYPNLNVHNIYINKDFKNNLNAPFNGTLSKNPSLYIYCPSSIDNSVCPSGCETINVMLRVPNLLHKNIKWDKATTKALEDQLLTILSQIDGLQDIKSHIIFKSCLTPMYLKNKFNTYAGSAFGLSHNLNQSLIFRPQATLPNIKNLYFTGASIHPGNGISMVLKSSKICANLINP